MFVCRSFLSFDFLSHFFSSAEGFLKLLRGDTAPYTNQTCLRIESETRILPFPFVQTSWGLNRKCKILRLVPRKVLENILAFLWRWLSVSVHQRQKKMSSSYFIDRRSSPLTFFLFCFLVFFFFLKIFLPLCPLVFLFLLSCCWCLCQWPHSPRSPGLQGSPVEVRRPLGQNPCNKFMSALRPQWGTPSP